MATLILTDSQQVDLSIDPRDKKNKPAKVDGAPVWASSNEAVITVTAAADGMSATVVAGEPGDAQVNVSADADLGDGVTTLTGTLDVTVTAGAATTLAVNAGAPTEQP